jgi:hypothetical protein
VLDRFQRGAGRAHPRAGGKSVPDGLHQLRADAHQAPHLGIQILAAGGGIAQHAAAGPAGHVHFGAETGLGAIQLVFKRLPVFLHAAQVPVRAQHAINGVCNAEGLPCGWRRRVCDGLGRAGEGGEKTRQSKKKNKQMFHGLNS